MSELNKEAVESKEKRAEMWVAENAKAFDCWNAYIEENGLPLAKLSVLLMVIGDGGPTGTA